MVTHIFDSRLYHPEDVIRILSLVLDLAPAANTQPSTINSQPPEFCRELPPELLPAPKTSEKLNIILGSLSKLLVCESSTNTAAIGFQYTDEKRGAIGTRKRTRKVKLLVAQSHASPRRVAGHLEGIWRKLRWINWTVSQQREHRIKSQHSVSVDETASAKGQRFDGKKRKSEIDEGRERSLQRIVTYSLPIILQRIESRWVEFKKFLETFEISFTDLNPVGHDEKHRKEAEGENDERCTKALSILKTLYDDLEPLHSMLKIEPDEGEQGIKLNPGEKTKVGDLFSPANRNTDTGGDSQSDEESKENSPEDVQRQQVNCIITAFTGLEEIIRSTSVSGKHYPEEPFMAENDEAMIYLESQLRITNPTFNFSKWIRKIFYHILEYRRICKLAETHDLGNILKAQFDIEFILSVPAGPLDSSRFKRMDFKHHENITNYLTKILPSSPSAAPVIDSVIKSLTMTRTTTVDEAVSSRGLAPECTIASHCACSSRSNTYPFIGCSKPASLPSMSFIQSLAKSLSESQECWMRTDSRMNTEWMLPAVRYQEDNVAANMVMLLENEVQKAAMWAGVMLRSREEEENGEIEGKVANTYMGRSNPELGQSVSHSEVKIEEKKGEGFKSDKLTRPS